MMTCFEFSFVVIGLHGVMVFLVLYFKMKTRLFGVFVPLGNCKTYNFMLQSWQNDFIIRNEIYLRLRIKSSRESVTIFFLKFVN